MDYRRLLLVYKVEMFHWWAGKPLRKKRCGPNPGNTGFGNNTWAGSWALARMSASNPISLASCAMKKLASQRFNVSTTGRLCTFPSTDTVYLAHHKPSKNGLITTIIITVAVLLLLLHPKGRKEINHKLRTLRFLCLECFLQIFIVDPSYH